MAATRPHTRRCGRRGISKARYWFSANMSSPPSPRNRRVCFTFTVRCESEIAVALRPTCSHVTGATPPAAFNDISSGSFQSFDLHGTSSLGSHNVAWVVLSVLLRAWSFFPLSVHVARFRWVPLYALKSSSPYEMYLKISCFCNFFAALGWRWIPLDSELFQWLDATVNTSHRIV